MRTGVRWHGPRYSYGEWMTPAILVLLIANTAVFFFQIIGAWLEPGASETFLRWFGLVPLGFFPGLRLWQPFTYLFLHGDLGHYFWNMLSLWMFGRDLERAWGSKKFYIFYFVVGVGAGLINVLARHLAGSPIVIIIGASGAIYGILMANAILFPDRLVSLLFPPVTMPMRFFVFIWGLLAFFGTLLPSGGNISHFTHLSGMAVAYLYLRRGSLLFRMRNRYSDWQRQRLRKKFEVYMRKQQDNEPPSRPDNWVN